MQNIRCRRGEGLLCAGRNRIAISFYASQKEHDAITISMNDLLNRYEQKRGKLRTFEKALLVIDEHCNMESRQAFD